MTLQEFSEVFAILAMQLRATDTDEATIRAYYRVLKDTDLELLRLAATDLAKSAQWFPKSSEWLTTTKAIETQRTFELSDRIRQLHRKGIELCANCGDTGWQRDENDRVSRCECQGLRRLEILGRRALPALR